MSKFDEVADQVLQMSDQWRRSATMLAWSNPMGFYVAMGCTLPEYIKLIDGMEATYRRLKERQAEAS